MGNESYVSSVFLAEAHEGTQTGNKMAVLKEKFNSLKLTEPAGGDKDIISEKTGDFFDTFSKGYKSVEQMEEIVGDSNKTKTQKQFAMNDLDLLGKVVYDSVRDNEKFTRLIGQGSASEIDENLPKEFKGIGKVVLTNVFEEGKVLEILRELDKSRMGLIQMSEGREKKKLKNQMVRGAMEKLAHLNNLTPGQMLDLARSQRYLELELEDGKTEKVKSEKKREDGEDTKTSEIGKNESDGTKSSSTIDTTGDPEIKEYLRAQAEYAQSRAILEKQIEKVSLNEILDSYLLIRAPRERAPQMWEYRVPDFMEGWGQEKQKEWRKLLSFEDAWLGAIYSKRDNSKYNNSLEDMKNGILDMKSLLERDFKTWYEDETLNLKGVMHQISRDLLTEKPTTQGALTRKIYAFDSSVDTKGKEEYVDGSRVKEFVDNEDTYKMGLVERLVEKKIVCNEKVAKLAVSLSMDIMEMGGVFSEADGLRKLSWESDAVRLAQRPERKYSLKVGSGELFAGPWTELANTLSQGDSIKALELVKSWEVIPELLSGSFLDKYPKMPDGKDADKTMMEMIYNNEKIPLKDLENDMFFGWRKDHIMPAARMWMYISNKVPLEFSKNREDDTVISQWRTDLYNDVNTLRANKDCIVSTKVIQGAIGGSVGLWPFEGPYLRINSLDDPNRVVQYMESATEIIKQLGLGRDENNNILQFFGIDKKYFNDLNHKMVAYMAIRNVTLPEWYKNKANKTLFTERPKR